MSESEYTPGPWIAREMVSGSWEIAEDKDGSTVARTRKRPDARLIHASPDLYKAAKCALWSLEATGRDVCDDGTPTKPARLLREAIKKVEGE